MGASIYDQQVADFLLRAKIRLSELTYELREPQLCACRQRLAGDLYAALRTLLNPNTALTLAQRLLLIETVTSLCELANVKPLSSVRGVVVRTGGENGSLDLRGVLSRIVVLEDAVGDLQETLADLEAAKYDFIYIYGGDPDTF